MHVHAKYEHSSVKQRAGIANACMSQWYNGTILALQILTANEDLVLEQVEVPGVEAPGKCSSILQFLNGEAHGLIKDQVERSLTIGPQLGIGGTLCPLGTGFYPMFCAKKGCLSYISFKSFYLLITSPFLNQF